MLKPLTTQQLGHEDALIVFKYDEFNSLMNEMINIIGYATADKKTLLELFWKLQAAKKGMIEC